LKAYSEALKSYAPGDEVQVRYSRGGVEANVKVKLTAR
jgi:S1-C subfamily serine protease